MEENKDTKSDIPRLVSEEESREDAELQLAEGQMAAEARSTGKTSFTSLSQVDADLALARRLQEQERAYMMLSMNNRVFGRRQQYFSVTEDYDGQFDDAGTENEDDFGVEVFSNSNDNEDVAPPNNENDDGIHDDDGEEPFDANVEYDDSDDLEDYNEEEDEDNLAIEFDPSLFSSDEAYARALQDLEEREMTSRLFSIAGLHDLVGEDLTDDENEEDIHRDSWEELDPDELSYEELLALGEVVGTESRGLSAEIISSLPSFTFKSGSTQTGDDSCVICRLEYEDDDTLTALLCKHCYHSECINKWLKINKVCPVCSSEVGATSDPS